MYVHKYLSNVVTLNNFFYLKLISESFQQELRPSVGYYMYDLVWSLQLVKYSVLFPDWLREA